ncbi:hypothetical protein MYA_5130 [Burkholderia sp. KJ006]|nr:hypothetical protein MYA_5130 [Burkholderia sp. KJ006]
MRDGAPADRRAARDTWPSPGGRPGHFDATTRCYPNPPAFIAKA